jgi:hypothetical protein
MSDMPDLKAVVDVHLCVLHIQLLCNYIEEVVVIIEILTWITPVAVVHNVDN